MSHTISIIVPVYNMAQFIRPCLESVFANGYSDIQVIVIDGGSSDGTVEVIKEYSDRLFYWVSEKDKGQSDAINKGFAVATGEILAWLNADEEYLPGVLELVARQFEACRQLDFVYGHRLDCDAAGAVTREIRFPGMHPRHYMLHYGRVLPSDCSFWTRRVHQLTGSLDEGEFQHLAMDYDWFLRMSRHVKGYRHLPVPFSKFKQQETRKTANAKPEEITRLWHLARERFLMANRHSGTGLLAGWAFWSFLARLQMGNFRIPSLRTVSKITARRQR